MLVTFLTQAGEPSRIETHHTEEAEADPPQTLWIQVPMPYLPNTGWNVRPSGNSPIMEVTGIFWDSEDFSTLRVNVTTFGRSPSVEDLLQDGWEIETK